MFISNFGDCKFLLQYGISYVKDIFEYNLHTMKLTLLKYIIQGWPNGSAGKDACHPSPAT